MDVEPNEEDLRLGSLLASYQGGADPASLRKEAGELFPELLRRIACLGALDATCAPAPEGPPAAFGRFRIEGVLGEGVSGVVYRARDGDRPVALKVMRASFGATADAARRFDREFEVARALEHPHIVRVLAHGEEEGRLYLATELVEGGSLAELLDEFAKRPDLEERHRLLDARGVADAKGARGSGERYARRLAALFAPVARALHHAHGKGLVHRDLKPGNLLLGRDGRLRLVDFGLAKVAGEDLTSTLAILGTPGFMSPEQACGGSRDVDRRCDVYGLGATLYRAVALRHPVEGEGFAEALAAIQTKRPAPLPREFPRSLDLVLSRCLEKAPGDRYPNAEALAEDLERVARGARPRIGRVPLLRRLGREAARHRRAAAVSGASLLALALGLAFWLTRPAYLEVEVWPEARIVLDGREVATGRYRGEVATGPHTLALSHPRFRAHEEALDLGRGRTERIARSLQPEDPFDPEALSLLAKAYGTAAPPLSDPARPRGIVGLEGDPPPDPAAAARPEEIEAALARFPREAQGRVETRLLAAAQLLADGRFAEAFAEARALADGHPGEPLPLRVALEALRRLRLDATPLYGSLHERYLGAGPEAAERALPGPPEPPPADAPRLLALLVGCTQYVALKDRPDYAGIELYGAGNDARLLARTLAERMGASGGDLRILADWPEDPAARPTRANILAALDSLASRARPGDRAVVLLAGHGTQAPDDDGDEADGRDELFLPADAGPWDGRRGEVANAIRDDELRERIRAIRAAGATVWLLLDCCHAGSGVRGGTAEGRTRRLRPEILGVPIGSGGAGGPASRPPLDLEGVAAMYASPSHRAAPELRLPERAPDAQWHGLLTFAVASQLRRAGPRLTFSELFARVLAACEGVSATDALPVAEGDLAMRVFAAGRSESPPLLLRREGAALTLDAGRLLGIGEGAVLSVFEPGGAGDDARRLGFVEVVEAGTSRSLCRAIARGGYGAFEPGPGPHPAELVAAGVPDMRLRLSGDLPAGIPERLGDLFVAAPADGADWRIERAPSGGFSILPAAGGAGFRLEADRLERGLRDLYRAVNLKRIAGSGVLPPLPEGLSVRLLREDGRAVAPGDALAPGDAIRLEVANRTRAAQDVNVFVLDARLGVARIFPMRSEDPRVEPGATHSEGPFRVNDESLGAEHVVVFASPRADRDPRVDLPWLAQRPLDERAGGSALERFLRGAAFGRAERGPAEAPDEVAASLLSWRTEWPAARPPAAFGGTPALCVRAEGVASLLARAERGVFEPASSRARPRGPLASIYRNVAPAVVVVRTRGGHGTGFLVDRSGLVLTNHHVVASGYETGPDGRPRVLVHRGDADAEGWLRIRDAAAVATVLDADEARDLALLRLDAPPGWLDGMEPVALAAEGPGPGEGCLLVGHPAAGLLWTVREGEVAQVGRMPHDLVESVVGLLGVTGPEGERARERMARANPVRIVLSTCAGNPGDSGSPLLDARGALLGVTFAIPRDLRMDKFVYHVHREEVAAFLARPRDAAPPVPDAWRLGPRVALRESSPGKGFDLLVAGTERPEQVLVDVDGDTKDARDDAGRIADLVEARAFDAEAAFHFRADRILAFYDRDGDGAFDLVLVDEDEDPEADVRYLLADGSWRVETGIDTPWLRASLLEFKEGAARATEKFRALLRLR